MAKDTPLVKKEPLLARIKHHPYESLIGFLWICNLGLIFVSIGIWIIAALQKLFVRADFTSFYTGYYIVRIGQGSNLYDAALQAHYQEKFMQGIIFTGGVLLFPNPPYVALLFSPLSILPLNVAFYFWSATQIILLIWAMSIIYRLFPDWSKQERIILITAILAFWPVINNLLLGQFSILLLIGVLQIYLGMKDSKPVQAGLGLLLLAIKPQSLLVPGMMTLNKRYWRAAATAAIGGVALFLITSAFLGFKPWIQYIQSVRALSSFFGVYGVTPSTEFTLRGILANILGNTYGSLINNISIIALGAALIMVWLLWLQDVPPGTAKFNLYFAFTITLSVFFSMHLNPHDALILVLPAALFYDYMRQNNYPRRAYTILALISPMIFYFSAFNKSSLLGILRPPVIPIFIFLIWMGYYLITERRIHARGQPASDIGMA
jgi:Glycosyltransferase family 87